LGIINHNTFGMVIVGCLAVIAVIAMVAGAVGVFAIRPFACVVPCIGGTVAWALDIFILGNRGAEAHSVCG
jgi:hypothetical protein